MSELLTIPAPRWGFDDGIGVVFYQGRCPWLFSHAPSGRLAPPRHELNLAADAHAVIGDRPITAAATFRGGRPPFPSQSAATTWALPGHREFLHEGAEFAVTLRPVDKPMMRQQTIR